MIRKNLSEIQSRILAAAERCGRDVAQIRLVAVSKTKPNQDIQEAYDAGHRHFGENYVQELVEKAAVVSLTRSMSNHSLSQLPSDIRWHFIGSLQSNKVKLLEKVPNLFAVESIDTLKKADLLNKCWASKDCKVNVFIQINTSGEDSKSGFPPSECLNAAKHILTSCPKLNLMGLMTIGAPDHELAPNETNPDFQRLLDLRKELLAPLGLSTLELSMGMSDDFEQAIQMGSTNVRVGSSIFGARNYNKA